MGIAIRLEIITHFEKYHIINLLILLVEAPKDFRIPISLALRSVMYDDKPNNPRHERNMARKPNIVVKTV